MFAIMTNIMKDIYSKKYKKNILQHIKFKFNYFVENSYFLYTIIFLCKAVQFLTSKSGNFIYNHTNICEKESMFLFETTLYVLHTTFLYDVLLS